MYPNRQFVVDGGLMSYAAAGPVFRLIGRNYAGEILKGAKTRRTWPPAYQLNSRWSSTIEPRRLWASLFSARFAAATEWIE
jgi:hypothetical protein